MGRLWWVSAGRGEGGGSLTGGTGGGGRKVPEGACERAEGAGHGGKVGKVGEAMEGAVSKWQKPSTGHFDKSQCVSLRNSLHTIHSNTS